jgi:hypothetical protein
MNSTAVFITYIAFIALNIDMVRSSLGGAFKIGLSVLLLSVIPYFFLTKYSEFFFRSMTWPFPLATVRLLDKAYRIRRGHGKFVP